MHPTMMRSPSKQASKQASNTDESTSLRTVVSQTTTYLLGSNQGKEHVEGHLHSVDKDETMLVGDELEVDRVDQGPDLPAALHGGKEIVLDLVSNDSEGVAVDETQVGEEDTHKDGAPEQLIDTDLERDVLGLGSWNLLVEPVVKVVSRGAVVDEAKDGEGDESLHVEGASANEDLEPHTSE